MGYAGDNAGAVVGAPRPVLVRMQIEYRVDAKFEQTGAPGVLVGVAAVGDDLT